MLFIFLLFGPCILLLLTVLPSLLLLLLFVFKFFQIINENSVEPAKIAGERLK